MALGNDILGDDAAGFRALRLLRDSAAPSLKAAVDFVETGEAGLAVLDLLEGYRRGLILDAVVTKQVPPGTVIEFSRKDFQRLRGSSLHVAERTGMRLPEDLRVLALEVETPDTFGEELTPRAKAALPGFVDRARGILRCWERRSRSPIQGALLAED